MAVYNIKCDGKLDMQYKFPQSTTQYTTQQQAAEPIVIKALLWKQLPDQDQEADTLFTLRLGLKLPFLIKLIVRVGSADSEPFLNYAAVDLDCRGTSLNALCTTLLFQCTFCTYQCI